MLIDEMLQQTEATEERFEAREPEREATVANLEAGGVAAANDPEQVRRRLERMGVEPEAVAKGEIFAEGAAAPKDPTLERILGNNDLLGVAYLEIARQAAASIGCVRVRQDGRNLGSGTGFLVSPRLLMTNNHVFKSADMARTSFVEFNYEDGPDGVPRPPARFDFEPDVFFLTDPGLDYSLVAVKQVSRDGQTPLSQFGHLPLLADDAKVLKGEPLNCIQHPNGEPKQLALRENKLVDILDQFLHYETDTAPGSSGSPMFNDQWEVVALHHSGVPKRDDQNRILARGGGVWSSEMGDQWIDWIANEGARVSRLIAHISAQPLGPDADALRKDLLADVALPPAPAPQPPATPSPAATEKTPPETIPQMLRAANGNKVEDLAGALRPVEQPQPAVTFEEGVATWTIPVQISVRIGQPTLGEPSTTVQQVRVAVADKPGRDRPAQPSGAPPAVEPPMPAARGQEVQAALDELAAAPTRVYYDAKTDANAVKTYYKGIRATASPDLLFQSLHQLLSATARQIPRYAPVKNVYPWVDLQPDLTIHSVYSDKVMNPRDLILDDAQVQEERALRLNEMFMREAAPSPEELAEEFDALEIALPYNCEHVVCQSWFRKAEPMRGDMHHLFACESGCNSFRGNTPYFDFPDFLEVVRGECGRREGERFEPQANKGKAARATLYFLLTYPGKLNSVMKIYDEERLTTILAWHKAMPVTDHERHRNQAIFAVQGNRNPLIDHPEWADKINFKLGL